MCILNKNGGTCVDDYSFEKNVSIVYKQQIKDKKLKAWEYLKGRYIQNERNEQKNQNEQVNN